MQREKAQVRSSTNHTDPFLAVRRISAINGILRLLCSHTGMGVAVVARVTEDDWQALAVHNELGHGMAVGDCLDVDHTLCKMARDEHAVLTINDKTCDPDFNEIAPPAVANFRSFAAAPIYLSAGSFFGTLCTFDPLPSNVEEQRLVGMFAAYAALIGQLLDSEFDATRSRENLGREQRLGAAREQFMAVVAHDLRNPLAAATSIAEILVRQAHTKSNELGKRL